MNEKSSVRGRMKDEGSNYGGGERRGNSSGGDYEFPTLAAWDKRDAKEVLNTEVKSGIFEALKP
jgi:hypothetical protein